MSRPKFQFIYRDGEKYFSLWLSLEYERENLKLTLDPGAVFATCNIMPYALSQKFLEWEGPTDVNALFATRLTLKVYVNKCMPDLLCSCGVKLWFPKSFVTITVVTHVPTTALSMYRE